MGWFSRKKTPEQRATTVQSASNFIEVLGLNDFLGTSAAGITVTTDKALGVPAVFAAVNFISGTIAGLPLQVYQRKRSGRVRVKTGVAPILHDAVNDEQSSYDWRKYTFERVLTTGRGFTFIERDKGGKVINLWPLNPEYMVVKHENGRRRYEYTLDGRKRVYDAAEIIDLPFMLASDGISHKSPINTCRDAIALAIASTTYGSKWFQGGGVPPFAVTGNFQSGAAMQRAADDLATAVAAAATAERQALVLPSGLEINQIGGDPERAQFIETKRFAIEEIARVYNIPPTFLQDLTHGTFSNTEQQDLHFVKHTLKRWVEQFEQEMNLKLFGRGSAFYVEFNVDGLLRGDFATRMSGHATAIQNGIATPDEVREVENRAPLPGGVGGNGWMQGAMAPMDVLLAAPTSNEDTEDGI